MTQSIEKNTKNLSEMEKIIFQKEMIDLSEIMHNWFIQERIKFIHWINQIHVLNPEWDEVQNTYKESPSKVAYAAWISARKFYAISSGLSVIQLHSSQEQNKPTDWLKFREDNAEERHVSKPDRRQEFEMWIARYPNIKVDWQEHRNCYEKFITHLAFDAWSASMDENIFLPHQENESENLILNITDIQWDLDDHIGQKPDLPSELKINQINENIHSYDALENYITDTYGFTYKGLVCTPKLPE